MKMETIKKRLAKDRPMVAVTLRMPEDVVEDLKRVAPMKGFGGYQALLRARELVAAGQKDPRQIRAQAGALLEVPGVQVEYFELADPKTIQPVAVAIPPVRAMGAIRIGATRLIDNLICT